MIGSGICITGQWGNILFAMRENTKRHASMTETFTKIMGRIDTSRLDRSKSCGKLLIAGTTTALPADISERYRSELCWVLGEDAKLYMPAEDFELYLCSA